MNCKTIDRWKLRKKNRNNRQIELHFYSVFRFIRSRWNAIPKYSQNISNSNWMWMLGCIMEPFLWYFRCFFILLIPFQSFQWLLLFKSASATNYERPTTDIEYNYIHKSQHIASEADCVGHCCHLQNYPKLIGVEICIETTTTLTETLSNPLCEWISIGVW